ncbi:hypothetical protein JCM17960_32610 [Magnetospira thiophila]
MDRRGQIFLRYVGGFERPATRDEILHILTQRPDLTAAMAAQD